MCVRVESYGGILIFAHGKPFVSVVVIEKDVETDGMSLSDFFKDLSDESSCGCVVVDGEVEVGEVVVRLLIVWGAE
jgi:translation initiation factor 1 (eIF-1/SUI1)